MSEWDPSHLKVLREGTTAWNAWRLENPDERPQLAGADFANADLKHVDLSSAILVGARFQLADLRGAKFRDALLLQADFSSAKLDTADLRGADMREAVLEGSSLGHALLVGADLSNANLASAELLWADLTGANLCDATLDGAYLVEAKLKYARIEGASFAKADLRDASFEGVDLGDADLSSVDLRWLEPNEVESIDESSLDEVVSHTANIPKGTRCASKSEFVRVLQRWYEGTDDLTIGDVGKFGGAAWLWVRVSGHDCHLNADTKREAVFQFLEWVRFRGPDYSWQVRANRRGIFNKVAVHPQGIETAGFYLYVKPALSGPASL